MKNGGVMDEYPKSVQLKDGTKITLKVMIDTDLDGLIEFFKSVPDEDRLYLRSDTKDPEKVKRRFGKLNYDTMFPILAVMGNKIIGIATLFRSDFGWMRNLGEIRVVISYE